MSDRRDGGPEIIPADTLQEIIDKLSPALRPDKRSEALRVITTVMQKSHQGPLPAPEDLEHYDQICPGAGERILAMAERSQNHRQAMESDHLNLEYKLQSRGQWLAISALVLMLILIGFTFWIGQPVAGSVLGSATILGIVGMFLGRDRQAEQEPPAKASTKGKPAAKPAAGKRRR